MTVDNSGNATVRYTDEHGQSKTEREHIDVPADLANGIVLTLLKNVRHDALPSQFSMIVATPKPRLVKLKIQPSADESFSTGGTRRKAAHYVLKIDIGGVKGLLAPLAGKQPPDCMSGFSRMELQPSSSRSSSCSWTGRCGASSW